jgi:group I intron endonuclease
MRYSRRRMFVYLITNRVNRRQYIGITTKTVARRWTNHKADAVSGSQKALHRAIRKYGVGAFLVETIATGLTPKGLRELERGLIVQYGTRSPKGYNMTDGGDGAAGLTHSAAAREKISTSGKGRIVSEETRRKMSSSHKGKVLSPEHRAKMAAAKLGGKQPPRSEIHRQRISEGLRQAWARRRTAI